MRSVTWCLPIQGHSRAYRGLEAPAEEESALNLLMSIVLGFKPAPVGLLSCSGVSGLLGGSTWKVFVCKAPPL